MALDQMVQLAAEVQSAEELAQLLRALRRRHARNRQEAELTYRELAARAGWSHTAIAEYLSGRTLPPTDRLDILLGLLGATLVEQGRWLPHGTGSRSGGAADTSPVGVQSGHGDWTVANANPGRLLCEQRGV